jgi:hypothetical protein
VPPDRPDQPLTNLPDRPRAAWALNLTNLTNLLPRARRGNFMEHPISNLQGDDNPNLTTFSDFRLVRLVRLVSSLFFNAIFPTNLGFEVGQVGRP